ncbi:unnamed protein product, partial [Brassica rapa]
MAEATRCSYLQFCSSNFVWEIFYRPRRFSLFGSVWFIGEASWSRIWVACNSDVFSLSFLLWWSTGEAHGVLQWECLSPA